MKSILIAGVAVMVLCGCVRTTSDALDERRMVISGRGNAFATQGEVVKASLQEAARQAKAKGYRYFQIAGGKDQTSRGAVYIPGQTYSSGTATANCFGANCTGSYQGQTYTTPGSAMGYVKPGADIYVRFYREGEIDPSTPGLWDANSVLAVADKA